MIKFYSNSKDNMLINSNYVASFKRIIITLIDFRLSQNLQHDQLKQNAECGGTNSRLDFDFRTSSSCFDFLHDLDIETASNSFDFPHTQT